jgi:hypothetical protein
VFKVILKKINGHRLVKHGETIITDLANFEFETLRQYLLKEDIEGIVFHHPSDGRMCKIRKTDFGIKR